MAKATTTQGQVKKVQQDGKEIAKEAAFNPWVERLTKLGYAVKGFLYTAIGFIAIASALGKSRAPADQLGAIGQASRLPSAQPFLWLILIGLIAYALWGVIRAVFDPMRKGTDMKGLLARGGYLISAATYASFAVPTYDLIRGARHTTSSSGSTVKLVSQVMDMPMGRWLVVGVGVAAILAGLYQIYSAIKRDYDEVFKPYQLSPKQLRVARQIGRYGIIARGIVFALVGFFIFLAGYQSNPGRAQGINGALKYLGNQPYGQWMLLIVALGLIAFGLYSFMDAAWFKLQRKM
jgi:hypothetical protein